LKKKILLLATFTLLGFPLLAVIINYFVAENQLCLFNKNDYPVLLQTVIGIFSGIVFAFIAVQIITADYMGSVLNKYLPLIKSFQLNIYEIIYISLCAGFGEEFFFRGFLQNHFGIWITAFIFVALHGYLDPRNLKITIYGCFMLLVIAAIGFMKLYIGLVSCIAAHTVIDIYLFYYLTFKINLPNDKD
jgi:uncharacterized protein